MTATCQLYTDWAQLSESVRQLAERCLVAARSEALDDLDAMLDERAALLDQCMECTRALSQMNPTADNPDDAQRLRSQLLCILNDILSLDVQTRDVLSVSRARSTRSMRDTLQFRSAFTGYLASTSSATSLIDQRP